ncbi:MAG TPA: hypothetical protein VGR51_08590, partial [Thermoplasmata archaeon]|nr:hypothetical protein [Thermoplasmata archaeon]
MFTDWTFGPYVLVPPPHVLAVSSVDLAPLVVNQGARGVLFQWLYFSTASPGGVNITRIQVDRIGTSTDADVDSLQLYNDVNATGSMAGALFVGASTFLGGRVSFAVSLRATPAKPAAVLLLINVSRAAVPDNTIGLEVRDASYISVGPNDVVQAFPAYRSTTALVNGPPSPNGLSVNGFGDGTAGIIHILGASPTLAWRFRDPNAADLTQVQFNVSVSSVSPSRLVFWHNESSALTSLPYAGDPLVPGTSYVMQIVASDGRLWSSPTGVLFRVNTPPPAPTLFAP